MVVSAISGRITGLSLGREGAGAALLRRGGGLPLLERAAFAPLPPECLRTTWNKPHLQEPAAVVERLQELREALPGTARRTVLTLPDATARILVLELDETWKNRDEAVEMILWRLRKNLPGDCPGLHLDFQVLQRKEGGAVRLLVAFAARKVVEQYEELVREAGFLPIRVELHQLSLIRAFAPQIEPEGTTALVLWHAENLTVVMLHDGIPVFWRSRHLPAERGGRETLERELHGSWEAYCRQWPGERTVRLFLCASGDGGEHDLRTELAGVWGEQQPVRLDPAGLYRSASGAPVEGLRHPGMIAAVAAAAGAL